MLTRNNRRTWRKASPNTLLSTTKTRTDLNSNPKSIRWDADADDWQPEIEFSFRCDGFLSKVERTLELYSCPRFEESAITRLFQQWNQRSCVLCISVVSVVTLVVRSWSAGEIRTLAAAAAVVHARFSEQTKGFAKHGTPPHGSFSALYYVGWT